MDCMVPAKQVHAALVHEVLAYFTREELVQLSQCSKLFQQHIAKYFSTYPFAVFEFFLLGVQDNLPNQFFFRKDVVDSDKPIYVLQNYLKFRTIIFKIHPMVQRLPDQQLMQHLWGHETLAIYLDRCYSSEWIDQLLCSLYNPTYPAKKMNLYRIFGDETIKLPEISLTNPLFLPCNNLSLKRFLWKPRELVEFLHRPIGDEKELYIKQEFNKKLKNPIIEELIEGIQQRFQTATTPCPFYFSVDIFFYGRKLTQRFLNSTTKEYLDIKKTVGCLLITRNVL